MAEGAWRNDDGVATWSAFLRAHAAVVRRIEGQLERGARLPLGWYDVLLELNAAPSRRLRMLDLGEAAVLSRSRVSRLVDELCTAGLVERQSNPADRRSSFAAITTEGRRVLRRAAPIYLRAVREQFASALSPEQLRVIRTSMETLLDSSQR
ncbi:MAG: MarR family winged helix-turn-helix transcriptional regulator [Acidimicrobiia bacterium]